MQEISCPCCSESTVHPIHTYATADVLLGMLIPEKSQSRCAHGYWDSLTSTEGRNWSR